MTYTPQGTYTELPQYRKSEDYAQQEYYQELLCLVLTTWFNANGFYQANITAAQLAAILAFAPQPPPGTHWFNTTLDVMQYLDNAGNVETVSAYPATTVISTGFASDTITNTDVNGMYATPIELIVAPSANQAIIVNNFVLELIYGSAPFAGGGNVYLQYGNTAHGTDFATPGTNIPAAFITGGANALIQTPGTINTTTGLATSVAGAASITLTNDTGAFTTGTGCSLRYYLWYSIIAIT